MEPPRRHQELGVAPSSCSVICSAVVLSSWSPYGSKWLLKIQLWHLHSGQEGRRGKSKRLTSPQISSFEAASLEVAQNVFLFHLTNQKFAWSHLASRRLGILALYISFQGKSEPTWAVRDTTSTIYIAIFPTSLFSFESWKGQQAKNHVLTFK